MRGRFLRRPAMQSERNKTGDPLQPTRYVLGKLTQNGPDGLAMPVSNERKCSLTARAPKAGCNIGTRWGRTDPKVRWEVETLPDDGGIYRMLLKGGHD